MKIKRFRIIFSICLMLVGIGIINRVSLVDVVLPAWNPASILSGQGLDHQVGTAVKIVDNKGNVISQACQGVSVGDEIINSEGKHFRITKLEKDRAVVKSLGMDQELLAWNEYLTDERLAMAAATRKSGAVGIYHTHTDESYVPSDGIESKPFKGGIYDVGQTFSTQLKEKSGGTILYDRTPHDPHDNTAYQRSRRTATKLMKENPVALIDVHRDGIPDPDYYSAKIADTNVSKLRLVVGRQNPNMQANLTFAKKMMAYANKVHPGIVKEIFMAKGNYNQDLMPTALLIEAGTHTNTKGQAERGITLFADAVPTVLGIEGGPTEAPGTNGEKGITGTTGGGAENSGGWKAVGWILGLTLLLGGGFLLISTGSLKGVGDRINAFGKEFSNYLGPVKKMAGGKKKANKGTKGSPKDQADRAAIDHRDDVTED